MRVLILDQYSEPGGAQQGLIELLPALRDRGWQATVGLPGEGELFGEIAALGFEAVRVECGPYRSGRKSAADLMRFVTGTPALANEVRQLSHRTGADIVYVNGPRLLPGVAMAGVQLPVLFHSHSYLFPGFGRAIAGMSLRRLGARIVANCEFVAAPWRNNIAAQRISVVYNGVAGPEAIGRKRRAAPMVGCIGRIAPEKGQREFVDAAALIHRAIGECRFMIFGAPLFSDAESERYNMEVRAAAEGLPVEFAGWITDVYAALASLDLLLVPSAGHEATTRVILEACAAGVPVIAFASGGIPEVVEQGHSGWLVGSVDEMALVAVELLNSTERLAAMSDAARDTWRRRFTLERYQGQMLAEMEKTAGPTSSARRR